MELCKNFSNCCCENTQFKTNRKNTYKQITKNNGHSKYEPYTKYHSSY